MVNLFQVSWGLPSWLRLSDQRAAKITHELFRPSKIRHIAWRASEYDQPLKSNVAVLQSLLYRAFKWQRVCHWLAGQLDAFLLKSSSKHIAGNFNASSYGRLYWGHSKFLDFLSIISQELRSSMVLYQLEEKYIWPDIYGRNFVHRSFS